MGNPLAAVGELLKTASQSAGGPLALALNPTALKTAMDNVSNALPPSPVMMGAVSRIFMEAFKAEQLQRGPSAQWIAAMQGSGRFQNEEEIMNLWAAMWSEL